jgi:opacity protein-like surface antigen
MRSFAAFGAALALTASAEAADYLRGTYGDQPTYSSGFTWAGPYAGGFAAYSSANFDASRQAINLNTQALQGTIVQPNLANLFTLGKTANTGFGGGFFIGQNWQYEDVVYGLEGEYALISIRATATNTNVGQFQNIVGPTIPTTPAQEAAGTFTDTTTTGTSTNRIKDYVAIRARAGYAMGRFLPYFAVGIGVARVDTNATVTLTYNTTQIINNYSTVIDPITGQPVRQNFLGQTNQNVPSASGVRVATVNKDAFKAGVTLGFGLDWAPFDNVFLRAEYQALLLSGLERVDFQAHSLRFGGGVKF